MKDFCKFVDVFYGSGEVDHFAEDGLASKWFYIKALSGNTVPHAVLPFGRMSAGAYSGGYPCGYGNNRPNFCGGVEKLFDTHKIRGFSHIHHSGVGGIGYYFNYAVTTPFYGGLEELERFYEPENETARPGFYSVEMNGISCELTVGAAAAWHRYRFPKEGGRLAVDFSNDGLSPCFGQGYRGTVRDTFIKLDGQKVFFSGLMSGIKLYFCAVFEGESISTYIFENGKRLSESELSRDKLGFEFGAAAELSGKEISFKLAFSTVSFEEAEENLGGLRESFEQTAEAAYSMWNEYLSAVEIEADDQIKRRFYSNLYHSLVKPSDMSGERVLGVEGETVTGFATFWDQYKTLFPLIYTLYPDMGERIAAAVVNVSRSLGMLPVSFDLTSKRPCEEQAKMLAVCGLCEAFHYGVKGVTPDIIDECIKRELSRADFEEFIEKGLFERYTHIIDTTDVLFSAAELTGDAAFRSALLELASNWSNAYGPDGLMSENSEYYEGDRYTYSFRLQANMEERIALAGGKEKFTEMLDSFFGFGRESVKQLTYVGAGREIDAARYHRFEGFNNECDMETPYAYIYAGRNDRTCEVIHAGITQSYLSGRGGLPGNNDSGGLSSCYVWNVLGLFPAACRGELLVGSPHIDGAVLRLASGKVLEIEVNRKKKGEYITDAAFFNGRPLTDFRIKASDLMKGGKLTVIMK